MDDPQSSALNDVRRTELVTRLVDLAAQAVDAGNDELALNSLSDALELEPSNAWATWQVGRYYGRKGAFAEAAEQYTRAVRLDPRLSSIEFTLRGHRIILHDGPGSAAPAAMLQELARDLYQLQTRSFTAGDVVVDVGAHIGSVAIVLAKLHPGITIVAYEPSAHNFEMLRTNLRENQVTNVVPVQQAVAGKAGTLELMWHQAQSAGASSVLPAEVRASREAAGWQRETVTSITLEQLFDQHRIDRCAFLKLDCEGAEWEIVRSPALERVATAAVELHLPASRRGEGPEALEREFVGLLTNRRHWPETKVPSVVWVVDS